MKGAEQLLNLKYRIDKDYFDAQEKRFAAHTAQTSLFDGEG